MRLGVFARVAPRLGDLGEKDRVTQLLREGQAIAKQLPSAAFAGFARAVFAEELSRIDLPAALDLIKDLSDAFEYDRHHGNIAHKLAGKEPAEAERILGMMKQPHQRDQWAVRVCYRMASVDLVRARRIATAINDPYQKAYAHGVMAQALAQSDKTTAAELLDEAFGVLSRFVDSGQDRFNGVWCACTVAGGLVPVAESIDPQLVPEFLWRATSFRLPRSGPAPAESTLVAQADATLAMMLARYDRTLAHTVLDPITERVRSHTTGDSGRGSDTPFVAAALIDPRWAVELIESLPDESSLDYTLPKNFARMNVANLLTFEGEERWQEVQKRFLALWIVDSEDL